MPAGGCYFQGSFDGVLTFDFVEVDVKVFVVRKEFSPCVDFGGFDGDFAAEEVDDFGDVVGSKDVEVGYDGGFLGVGFGEDDAFVAFFLGEDGDGEGAFDGFERAVERHFAHHHVVTEAVGGYVFSGCEDGDGDGEVVGCAFFADVGGRHVDHDLFSGEG